MTNRIFQSSDEACSVLALIKGGEHYVFIFTDENRMECVRQLGRFAANQELSFTWSDAAVLSQKIRCGANSDA